MKQMKDSGIEWIGETPEDWKFIKIGSIFRCRNEKVNDTDYPPLSVTRNGIVPQMENVAKTDANDNRKMVKVNDFVINSRSDRKQSCGVSDLDGSVSLINTVLYTENTDVILPEYTNLLMKNYGFAEEFYRWGHGIVADLWTTRWQEMKSIVLPLPNTQQQEEIVRFVQKKVCGIDNLIAHEQATIDELKAYKQSVITEAVTKGLDKSAPMKDSGVGWIGEIPETWKIEKIKFNTSNRIEKSNGQILQYIGLENIESFTGKFVETENTYDVTEANVAYKGDVLFGKLRPYLAKAFIAISDIFVSGEFAIFCADKIYNGFLRYYFISYGFLDTVNASTYGTKMPRANVDFIKNCYIVLPSFLMQQQIVDYLDKKCADIDRLISIKQQKIEKLQEYKKSLIYEYVTGKKEVA